jgi:2-polyprenyl-6-methoxyphenol hydroxylase-like FAD-dependent oxidoreductase
LHRSDLHAAIAAHVYDLKGVVHLNARVSGYDESNDGITVRLANGSSVTGDLLIGADGVKSAVHRAPACFQEPRRGRSAQRLALFVQRADRAAGLRAAATR